MEWLCERYSQYIFNEDLILHIEILPRNINITFLHILQQFSAEKNRVSINNA